MNITLVTANKNYSTWSLRPWLLLKAFRVHFNEVFESLNGDDLRERLLQHTGDGKGACAEGKQRHRLGFSGHL